MSCWHGSNTNITMHNNSSLNITCAQILGHGDNATMALRQMNGMEQRHRGNGYKPRLTES